MAFSISFVIVVELLAELEVKDAPTIFVDNVEDEDDEEDEDEDDEDELYDTFSKLVWHLANCDEKWEADGDKDLPVADNAASAALAAAAADLLVGVVFELKLFIGLATLCADLETLPLLNYNNYNNNNFNNNLFIFVFTYC